VALLILLAVQIHRDKIRLPYACFLLVLALLMGTVTSGTFVVIWVAMLLLGIWLAVQRHALSNRRLHSVFLALIIVLSFPYLLVSLNKNLTYFGGGSQAWIAMLSHGFGKTYSDEADNSVEGAKSADGERRGWSKNREKPPKAAVSSQLIEEFGTYLSYLSMAALASLILTFAYWRRLGRIAHLKAGFSSVALIVGFYGFSALTLAILPSIYLVAMIGDQPGRLHRASGVAA
jgi:hypothetical protein